MSEFTVADPEISRPGGTVTSQRSRFHGVWGLFWRPFSSHIHVPCVLVVRVENETHIVHITGWLHVVSIIQTYRPWTPRRMSGQIVNKKIWRKSEAYRNFSKWFDWSLAIKRHIVMAAPLVETIWLVNGFKRHVVMASTLAVTAPSSFQNLIIKRVRQDDLMVSRGVLMIETINNEV